MCGDIGKACAIIYYKFGDINFTPLTVSLSGNMLSALVTIDDKKEQQGKWIGVYENEDKVKEVSWIMIDYYLLKVLR